MVNKRIQLDFTEEGLRENVEAVQGDTGRTLLCHITGVDMTGVSARFYAVKKSGKEIYNNCSVSGNNVTVELTEQTLAETGIVKCQLDLRKGSQKVQSFIFNITVTASLAAQSEYLSSNEYKVVDDLAGEVEDNKNKIAELDDKKANKDDYGSPLTASTVSAMTDKKKVYVYTGSESGYTAGNWYSWDGSKWVSGGVYNSAAIQTDETLTQSGKAADSAKVGKEIQQLTKELENVVVTDGSITTEKIANEAITIDKLDPNISNMLNGDKGLTAEQKRYIIMLFKNAVFSENMVDTVTALEDSFNTIPATGIKLNPATIKFASIGDTQKITATLTPDTATSSIIWESNNTDVVTVQNGVATAVNDGMAVITATSGSATAKCNVTVNTKELYSVSNKICNADFYEATGLKFGSDTANGWNKSWTLFINCSVTEGKIVYGVNSDVGDAMDLSINGAKACRVSNAKGVYGANRSSNDITAYVLVHEANSPNISVYQYINEEVTNQAIGTAYNNLSNSTYNGEVYIGGKTSANYVGTIYDFSIIMRKATNSEIETYLKGCVY